ncbi:hypothetical protein BpHYR1_023957 [Brachionus plicatilis]|uniref:Uncharacterized protein n=1 Tax=Brachionus plicatilis TaxID=10195 RepID=A0A3M7SPN0_BRAPC|nr:hypothetical protein BpHYR1_023957 [Brachionus plicatilis]
MLRFNQDKLILIIIENIFIIYLNDFVKIKNVLKLLCIKKPNFSTSNLKKLSSPWNRRKIQRFFWKLIQHSKIREERLCRFGLFLEYLSRALDQLRNCIHSYLFRADRDASSDLIKSLLFFSEALKHILILYGTF